MRVIPNYTIVTDNMTKDRITLTRSGGIVPLTSTLTGRSGAITSRLKALPLSLSVMDSFVRTTIRARSITGRSDVRNFYWETRPGPHYVIALTRRSRRLLRSWSPHVVVIVETHLVVTFDATAPSLLATIRMGVALFVATPLVKLRLTIRMMFVLCLLTNWVTRDASLSAVICPNTLSLLNLVSNLLE